MQTNLPELQNTDEKHTLAVSRLEQIHKDFEYAKEASRAAQRQIVQVQQRLQDERTALTAAQRALTDALAHNAPLTDLQQAVSGHQMNLSSLETLLEEANQAALECDKDIGRASQPMNTAQNEVYSARFLQLTVQLAKVITPAIPICRELETLSHKMGIGLSESGYVLDLQRPNIGRYSLADDGLLFFHLR